MKIRNSLGYVPGYRNVSEVAKVAPSALNTTVEVPKTILQAIGSGPELEPRDSSNSTTLSGMSDLRNVVEKTQKKEFDAVVSKISALSRSQESGR
jgi:hypothetical protein